MRLNLKKNSRSAPEAPAPSLADLAPGEEGILLAIDLGESDAARFMEMGFLPGSRVIAASRAPGGDPRVFRVDGSEIAVRRETARRFLLALPGIGGAE